MDVTKLNTNIPNKNKNAWRPHTNISDIIVGLLAIHVWVTLGWHDIRQRYRRSVLGPFWFTLSTLIMVGVLGLLYSKLLGQDIKDYLPYLGVGLILWQFISSCILEGAEAFISAGYLIKQIRMPLTVHVARIVWRNFVILMHSLPVLLIFLLFFGHKFGFEILLLIPGLIILLLNVVWIGIVLGIICARYRDVLPIIANLVQVTFFFSPIMWLPDLLQERMWVADLNPVYHLIEIVRAPMIGRPLEWLSWLFAVGLILVGFALAQYLMNRCRNRVPYWL